MAVVGLSCSAGGNKDKSQAKQPEPVQVVAGTNIDASSKKAASHVTSSECTTIREAIETRNLTHWKGLPAACRASDLFDHVPADVSDRPQRSLGGRTARWVLLKLEGYYRPMASFVDGKFVMFDSMNPTLAVKASDLVKQLGTPAARTDWWYGGVEMKDGAYVYPDKGITLFLNSNTRKALHIALYHPTDLAGWKQDLRPRLHKKTK